MNRDTMSQDRKPAEVFAPGKIIEEERIEQGWTKQYLAERLGVSMGRLNAIVDGRASISVGMAMRLGEVFGTGKQLWINMEKIYRAGLVERLAEGFEEVFADGSVRCEECDGRYVKHEPCSRWRCPKCTPECDCKEAGA